MTVTAPDLSDVVAAIAVIHDTAFDRRHHDPQRIADADNTLVRRRHVLTGELRNAVDHYLAEDTWHHGPRHLRWAIHQVATHARLNDPDNIGPIAVQASLF